MVALPLFPMSVPFVWLLLGALAFYVAALVVYRAFISPLASIPGPKLAGLTSWYECYYGMSLTTPRVLLPWPLRNKPSTSSAC